MSALALPISPAPARPGAPQGLTGNNDATGFKSLLDSSLFEQDRAAGGPALEPVPEQDQADTLEASAEVPAPPLTIVVQVPAAPPVETAPDVTTAATAEASTGMAEPGSELSALLASRAGASGPMTSAVDDGTSEGGDAGASSQPVIPAPAEPDAALQGTAAEARRAAAAAAAEIGKPPQGSPVPLTLPTPTPPPLRALAERTSKPLETSADKTVDASTSGASTAGIKAGAASASNASDAPVVPDRAGVPAGSTPKPGADARTGSDTLSMDAVPVADGSTSSSPTVTQTRETSLSSLSRATIDATAQIAAQILRKLEGRSTRFEMALTPDDLGRVDVKLDIDSEGRLAARLAFDNPAAATDLRGRADQLRRELEDAGFHLADDAFEFTERDSNSSSFDRGQDTRQGQNRAFAAASRLNAEIDVAQPPRWMALSLSPAGVDLKV